MILIIIIMIIMITMIMIIIMIITMIIIIIIITMRMQIIMIITMIIMMMMIRTKARGRNTRGERTSNGGLRPSRYSFFFFSREKIDNPVPTSRQRRKDPRYPVEARRGEAQRSVA